MTVRITLSLKRDIYIYIHTSYVDIVCCYKLIVLFRKESIKFRVVHLHFVSLFFLSLFCIYRFNRPI